MQIATLNEEQLAAVQAPAGPLLVVATAGAGKTKALVERIRELLRRGADPSRILAVTFSVKAAKEMTSRLAIPTVRIGTFHSVALQIVRAELPGIATWRIDDTDRYRLCVKDAVSFRWLHWQSADVTHLLSFIARCKAEGALPDSPRAIELAAGLYQRRPSPSREPTLSVQAYMVAEEIRRERQLLTFDDLLVEADLALANDEHARVRWSSHWDHVLQDEAQDENSVQHSLIEKLARDHRSYTIVGDPAQSIFGFRGAAPRALLTFERDWGAQVVRMGANYRCATSIVEVGNRTLAAMPDDTHLGVRMVAMRTDPGLVRVTRYEDFDAEGQGVTDSIVASHEDGLDWSDHVVLYRTNAQSRGVEECLLSARVPYVVLGGTNFYERREVKDLLAYMRLAAGIGTYEDVKRSINTPFRFLGKAFVDGLEQVIGDAKGRDVMPAVHRYAVTTQSLQQRQRTSAVTYCELVNELGRRISAGEAAKTSTRDADAEVKARPSVLLEHLVRDLRYNEWLTRDEGAESPENNRVSNVRELVRAADRFPTVGELLAYVADTTARAAVAKQRSHEGDVVTLCSIHRSKGLEYPVVYLIGANEKILPHAYSEDSLEERRLFYVACTRARDVLEVSYVARAAVHNRVLTLTPSRFLEEAGLDVVEGESAD